MANSNPYGLAAAVWTADIKKAHMVSRRLKAGTVWINTYGLMDAALPFGGLQEFGLRPRTGQARDGALHGTENRLAEHGVEHDTGSSRHKRR